MHIRFSAGAQSSLGKGGHTLSVIKGTLSRLIIEFLFPNFLSFLPNATKYTNKFDKKIPQKRWNSYFEEEVQDCKDGSGLRLIFGQDVQKSKLPFW